MAVKEKEEEGESVAAFASSWGAGAFGRFILESLAPRREIHVLALVARSEESRLRALSVWHQGRECEV
ncbi:MAG: hypothetical protein QJR00_07195 [Bacillota bacterium]|nr:hypothetical protein [Bacillota bacterium]